MTTQGIPWNPTVTTLASFYARSGLSELLVANSTQEYVKVGPGCSFSLSFFFFLFSLSLSFSFSLLCFINLLCQPSVLGGLCKRGYTKSNRHPLSRLELWGKIHCNKPTPTELIWLGTFLHCKPSVGLHIAVVVDLPLPIFFFRSFFLSPTSFLLLSFFF
jgi:hypothetical protein